MSENPEEMEEKGHGIVGRTAIIKVNPLLAEENLFEKLQQQVVEYGNMNEILKKYSDMQGGPQNVMALVHILLRQAIAKPLGHIIPPDAGSRIVKDRIVQFATILLEMLRERVRELEKEIMNNLREGKEYEVEKNIKEMINLHHDSLIAIRELMNRYLVLYYLNLPAHLRPPLAQLKLGIEVIRT